MEPKTLEAHHHNDKHRHHKHHQRHHLHRSNSMEICESSGVYELSGLPLVTQEVVAYAIRLIMESCERVIEDHVWERDSLRFAAGTVVDVSISHVAMHHVPFDEGETDRFEWELESEPRPEEADCLAAHLLYVRDKEEVEKRLVAKSRQMSRFFKPQPKKSPKEQAHRRGSAASQSLWRDSRSSSLNVISSIDSQEDEHSRRLMAERALARQKIMDEYRRQEEEDRRKRAEMLEAQGLSLLTGAHLVPMAFDSAGHRLNLENVDLERLPHMLEIPRFDFPVPKDRIVQKPKKAVTMQKKPDSVPPTPSRATARRNSAKAEPHHHGHHRGHHRRPSTAHEFTDGCVRPEYAQPPLEENMVLQPGVELECCGKRTWCPTRTHEEGRLAWKEYAVLQGFRERHQENSFEKLGGKKRPTTAGAVLSSSKERMASNDSVLEPKAAATPGEDPVEASQPTAESAPSSPPRVPPVNIPGSRRREASESQLLKPPVPTENSVSPSVSPKRVMWVGDCDPSQNAPAEPAPGLLASRRAAAMHAACGGPLRCQWRAPRDRVATLGVSHSYVNTVQPPLGATMGHGLIRSGTQDCFYFPPSSPDCKKQAPMAVGRPLSRARSAGSLRRPASASGPSRRAWCP